jgi:hypothetical protein
MDNWLSSCQALKFKVKHWHHLGISQVDIKEINYTFLWVQLKMKESGINIFFWRTCTFPNQCPTIYVQVEKSKELWHSMIVYLGGNLQYKIDTCGYCTSRFYEKTVLESLLLNVCWIVEEALWNGEVKRELLQLVFPKELALLVLQFVSLN